MFGDLMDENFHEVSSDIPSKMTDFLKVLFEKMIEILKSKPSILVSEFKNI